MVTYHEIAKNIGVSPATVSRVVNNTNHPINPETRQKVLNALREVQYSRNAFEQMMAGQCYMIELFLGYPLMCDPGFPYVVAASIAAIKQFFRDRQCQVIIDIDDNLEESMKKAALMREMPSAGCLLIASDHNKPLVDLLLQHEVPCVILGTREYGQCHFIDSDHISTGRRAVQHLAGLGRRKIACVSGPAEVLPCREVVLGFNAMIKELNLPANPDWIKRSPESTVEMGRMLTAELIDSPNRPDAINFFTDFLAVGAINAIKDAGLRVPEDISIIGYDDFPIATSVYPQLTTFRHPIPEMVDKALEWLIDSLVPRTHCDFLHQEIVLPELIIRESCGAHAGKSLRPRKRRIPAHI